MLSRLPKLTEVVGPVPCSRFRSVLRCLLENGAGKSSNGPHSKLYGGVVPSFQGGRLFSFSWPSMVVVSGEPTVRLAGSWRTAGVVSGAWSPLER
jgi:hypothetical protein